MLKFKLAVVLIFSICLAEELIAQDGFPIEPVVAKASNAGLEAISGFQLPPGTVAELVAAEPLVANPVAFTIDDQGRIYVCETFRQEQGVTDNRSHDAIWVDHDLAALTVEDRIAYHQKLLPNQGLDYTRQDDRIRLLIDENGDGTMERSQVFANRFNGLEEGTGAGVLVVDGTVLFTCIPHLWSLTDTTGDGVADERRSLQSGFGVRVAFRGHDMHGLIRGPDGRIYFSIGDRGYHLRTADQRVLANPESGAVFRCQPDGSQLEVVATGLRNPQELAFDKWGNLFTGDNNSDSGDRARWVFVLPGADSGWRMSYQYLADRGPFNREKIWHPFHEEQPVCILPPVANLGDGPSGLAYYPGTGFADGFADHFLMCDFRGSPADSGIRAFQVRPQGAFFELSESQQVLWRMLPTDLAFGPDGFLYTSDWVNGWVGEGRGRLYRFGDPETVKSEEVRLVQRFLAKDTRQIPVEELKSALSNIDQRVRLKGQYELARRREIATLVDSISSPSTELAQIHALWGLWQIGLQTSQTEDPANAQIEQTITELLGNTRPEIRAQAARIAGELKWPSAFVGLLNLLDDQAPRVQMMAALALANFQVDPAQSDLLITKLVDVLAQNNNRDPALRHAVIMGLTATDPRKFAAATQNHPSVAVRRAAVVVLRKQNHRLVETFLNDSNLWVVDEAARAIYDQPIPAALPALADALLKNPAAPEFTRRAMHACFRVGRDVDSINLAALAKDSRFSFAERTEAIRLLGNWGQAMNRDPVVGMWRPVPPKPTQAAADTLAQSLPELILSPDTNFKTAVFAATKKLLPDGAAEMIVDFCRDTQQLATLRAAALDASREIAPQDFLELATMSLADPHSELRITARRLLAESNPNQVADSIIAALDAPETRERQAAYATLVHLPSETVLPVLLQKIADLSSGMIPPDTRLDLREAVQAITSSSPPLNDALTAYLKQTPTSTDSAAYRDALEGGDAERGRILFYEKTQLSCLRCHRIGLDGGNVGPNLSDVGKLRSREHLLQSIVEPNAEITEKYGTIVVLDDSGKTTSGILHMENEHSLRLLTAEGEFVTIAQEAIIDRRTGESAMPKNLIESISPMELRDLVEFLSQQKSPRQPDVESLEIDGGLGNSDPSTEQDPNQ